jgi:4-alpha-glucanotransferase/glycosidase
MSGEWLVHNSRLPEYRSPFGAVSCGQEIALALAVDASRPQLTAEVRIWLDGHGEQLLPMIPPKKAGAERLYRAVFAAPAEPGLIWYYFIIHSGGETFYYGNNSRQTGGVGAISSVPPPSFQITVHRSQAVTPAWFKDAVVYQIFVDRFYNGNPDGEVANAKPGSLIHAYWENDPVYVRERETGRILAYDFFGGNLAGVIAKLPYLKDLGISALYLNPVFEAPSNHKYDTADYKNIDGMFGDNRLFHELCAKAGELDMNIILDGVFSHTGSDSIYFNKEGRYPGIGAYQSTDSPYYSWYRFQKHPDVYESWWGVDALPNVDELNPSYLDFMVSGQDSVVKHWLRLGAKGWRLDVADELPDRFIRLLREAVKETDPEAVIIGEVWEDASRKVSYSQLRSYFSGDELDAATNYPFRQVALDFLLGRQSSADAGETLYSLYENYPRENFYAAFNLIGSHDVPRALTLLGGYDGPADLPYSQQLRQRLSEDERGLGIRRLKMLALWQMTFPGVPCVYYGDEAGLEGYREPLNRRTFPWGREETELQAWYRKVINLRNDYHVLRSGDWQPLALPDDVLGYVRWHEGGRDFFGQSAEDNLAVVLINRSQAPSRVEIDINRWCRSGLLFDLLADCGEVPVVDGRLAMTLPPLGGRLLVARTAGGGGRCGVLCHPTSLPSAHSVGGLGAEAREFVDFLAAAGQNYWQILPLNPLGFGNSPYQSISAFACEPLLIDIDSLVTDGLLTAAEVAAAFQASGLAAADDARVDYQAAANYKGGLFRQAYGRFAGGDEYNAFCRQNADWLDDYTLYMALTGHFSDDRWWCWPRDICGRQPAAISHYRELLAGEIGYHAFLQYTFRRQWQSLRRYANTKGVGLIGDLPIFVAQASSDVWANRRLFQLDAAGQPLVVAGVPPDYFSKTGQLWGNPLYDWTAMAEDDYRWWRSRFTNQLTLTDVIRVDHFRGFAGYWAVPAGAETAESGQWNPGPGSHFFTTLERHLGKLPLIAEDLGIITPDVIELRKSFGYPGMRVLQFAFACDGNGDPLPLGCPPDTVVYPGTHDNDTVWGWYRELAASQEGTVCADRYLGGGDIAWRFLEIAYQCRSALAVISLQDILGLDGSARMNTPGTVGDNWAWRCRPGQLTADMAGRLAALAVSRRQGDRE